MRKVNNIADTASSAKRSHLYYSTVLQFLHGMAQGEEPDDTPPLSLVDPDEFERAKSIRNGARSPQIYSPAPRSKTSETLLNTGMAGMLSPRKDFKIQDLVEEVNGDDANSNVQDGIRSELGEMKAVRCYGVVGGL